MNIDLKIKDLPPTARDLAIINQEKQGRVVNTGVLLMDSENGFKFDETPEGADFWVAIMEFDFIKALINYKGPSKLFVLDGHGNEVTYYFIDGSSQYFNMNENILVLEKALELQEKLIKEKYIPLFGTKTREEMGEEKAKEIDRVLKLWRNKK